MLENIIVFLISLFVLFLLFVLLNFIYEKTDKINHGVRFFLVLPFSLLTVMCIGGAVRLFSVLASFIWGEDTLFNIYFISCLILPFISNYSFVNAGVFMSPRFKVQTAFVLSFFLISINIFIFYNYLFNNTFGFSDFLLDEFKINIGTFGQVIYIIAVLLGLYISIKHSKTGSSYFD